MNEMNKNNLLSGGKVFCLFFFAIVAIIAFAGNLNALTAHPELEHFYGWGAGINFVAEIVLIFCLRKSWKNKANE